MGTRHLQKVINEKGEVKVSQYGQWDGYPDYQGVKILEFLRNSNLDDYLNEVNKVRMLNDGEIDEIVKSPHWDREYPHLSRDCGYDIHYHILNGDVEFVENCGNYLGIEGYYTIDFKNGTFSSYYHGDMCSVRLDNLPTDEDYLKQMNVEDE